MVRDRTRRVRDWGVKEQSSKIYWFWDGTWRKRTGIQITRLGNAERERIGREGLRKEGMGKDGK